MFDVIKKHAWKYVFEVIIAIIVFSFGLRPFLIYAFIMLVMKIDMVTDYLRKLIRVFHVSNETKLMAIMRKLKISDEDVSKILEETKGNLTEEQWASFEKDFKDISSN